MYRNFRKLHSREEAREIAKRLFENLDDLDAWCVSLLIVIIPDPDHKAVTWNQTIGENIKSVPVVPMNLDWPKPGYTLDAPISLKKNWTCAKRAQSMHVQHFL